MASIKSPEQPFLEVYYEDLAGQEGEHQLARIFRFLGVAPHSLAGINVPHQRQNPFPISELVTNFDELATALEGTEYEWMLDD